MELDIARLLHETAALLLFTVLALGLLLGRTEIRGFRAGATAGVLTVGLVFGYLGFGLTAQTESLGFMLFIFCIGIEAGPNFFSAMAQDGLRYVFLSLVVVGCGVLMALGARWWFELEPSMVAGLFAGALTSTPSLVGAQDAILTRLPELTSGDRDALINRLSGAYALAYVVGLLGILVLVRYLPRFAGVDLAEEAGKLARQRGMFHSRRAVRTPILRAYRVDDRVAVQTEGKTLRELGLYERFGLLVERIKRDGEIIIPDSETVLQLGDRFALVGFPSSHAKIDLDLLDEVFDPDLIEFEIDSLDVVVVRSFAVGHAISELRLEADWGCFAHRLERGQVELPLDRKQVLAKGDVLSLSGEKARLVDLADKIGFVNQRSDVSDLVAFSAFFVLGLLVGQFQLVVGDMRLALGNAGGLLLSGVLMGYLRAVKPTFGHVPQGALNMLKDLGLNIFMVSVGLSAGAGIIEVFYSSGGGIVAAAFLILCAALLLGYAFGRLVLRMNPALLLGAITGAMTSTPAMGFLNEASRSTVPALGYVGTYAVVNILLTMTGTALVLL
jgi:putative transport protein